MKKTGFTLIELLAVIVILAIIALIAVPIVIHIIDDSKKSSEKESIKLYLDTVEKMVAKKQLNNISFNPKTCAINNKKITCDGIDVEIEMKGEIPNKGIIFFSNGKLSSAINLELNGKKFKLENGEIKEGETSEVEVVIPEILEVIGTNYTGTCKITGENKITCGTEEEKTMDISYIVSGGTITFSNGTATEYKNVNINGTYYHKKEGEEESVSQHEIYANLVNDTGEQGLSIGDKYTYDVNDTDTFNFYVLSIDNNKVNLIMDRNICNDGSITYTSTNNYCRYQWYSSANNNTYGPTTVMAELYAGTKDWDNVSDMIMNYTDENNGTATDKGYTSIITSNGVTTITGKPESNTTTVGTSSKPLKARLPKQSEVMGAGCTTGTGSCPTWLMENIKYYNVSNDKYSMNNNSEAYQNQIYGYWLLSSDPGNSTYARIVYYSGNLDYGFTTNGYGARPVITVSTSDLSS